jgi:hypothetical protein
MNNKFYKPHSGMFFILSLFLLSTSCVGGSTLKDFINAVHEVEASGSFNPPDGKFGEIGCFQITEPYWLDSGVECTFEECRDYNTAIKVMIGYFSRYEKQALENNKWEILARLHNSGPNWREKKHLTNTYWAKIQKHLDN